MYGIKKMKVQWELVEIETRKTLVTTESFDLIEKLTEEEWK